MMSSSPSNSLIEHLVETLVSQKEHAGKVPASVSPRELCEFAYTMDPDCHTAQFQRDAISALDEMAASPYWEWMPTINGRELVRRRDAQVP